MPTYQELGGSGLQQFLTNPADAMHTYFKSILKQRKAGENVAILIDEADQYLRNELEFNKFIEAAEAHGIPLLLTTNNPAKFKDRGIRRSVPFDMMNFNNIDVNAENGMKNAKDVVKDVFKQAKIKAQINEDDLEKIVNACVDTKSAYLKSEYVQLIKKDFKPVSMKAIDEFSTLIKQKAEHSVYSNENREIDTTIIDEIVDIAGSWLNKTGEYVDPNRDSGVHVS